MIFNKYKTSDVYYDIDTKSYNNFVPKGFFSNPELYKTTRKINCPAVNTFNKRMYCINSPLDIKVTIKKDENNVYSYYFEYKNAPFNQDVHNLINEMFHISFDNDILTFQFTTPYCFYTDKKDIEIVVAPPNIVTKNIKFISGAFKISNWIRAISCAWIIQDIDKEAVIEFKTNKPLYYLIFNKNVNVTYKPFNNKTQDYFNNIKNIVKFKTNVNKYSVDIIKRKPKRFT